MNIYTFKDAFLVGVFMSFMIGPVFFMLIKTSILKGARAAISFDLGVIFGDICFMLMAYFGSRSLLEKVKDDPRLFLIGGFILIVYGVITILTNKKETLSEEVTISKEKNYFKLFINGFLLNFINVGVLAFWLGLLVVIGPSLQMNPVAIFWYLATVIIGYFTSDLGKIFLAKQLKSKLTPVIIFRIKRGMGIMLIIFGVLIMLKGFVPKEKIDSFIKKVENSAKTQ